MKVMVVKTVYILLLVFCVTSCQHKEEVTLELQVPGTYIGLAPCTHCNGVFSGIIFEKDKTVRFFSSPEQQNTTLEKGIWTIKDSLIQVIMRNDTFYYRSAVPDSIISLYRNRQNPVKLIESYTLKKYLQNGK